MNKFSRFISALSIFTLFFVLHIYHPDLFLQMFGSNSDQTYTILFYIIEIGLWLSGVYVFNFLLEFFFWDRFVARSINKTVPRLIKDIVTVIIYLVASAIMLNTVFNIPLTGFWATSSIVALIVGFALRNIIMDLFTGVAVSIDNTYNIGDWILVHQRQAEQNVIGKVLDINWRTTRLLTEENTLVVIPNSLMSTFVITNYSNPELPSRFESFITLDYSISESRAKRVILAGLKQAQSLPGFYKEKEPQVLVNKMTELGIEYKIRYWILPWKVMSPSRSRDKINTFILQHLYHAGLTPAIPKEKITIEKISETEEISTSLEERIKLISKTEIFRDLDNKEILELAQNIKSTSYKTGQTVINKGDDGFSMFILVEGLLDVYIGETGAEYKVAQLDPGKFFGEMSLFTGEKRSATIVAATESSAYEITKENMLPLIENRPEIAENISSIISSRKIQNKEYLTRMKQSEDQKNENERFDLVNRIRSFFRSSETPKLPSA